VLGLSPSAVTGTGLPVQSASCGVPFLLVPLTSRRAVDSAAFDATAYDAFRGEAAVADLPIFLFSTERSGDNATVYSRMFAPGFGIAEDPATGAASGPLGCYLVRHKIVPPDNSQAILSLQGVKMGRPSYIHVAIGVADGEINSVRVGGESITAGEGTLYL
jgi:trans-2,3-dihydro-3-hydroxyanthranilate isomerase